MLSPAPSAYTINKLLRAYSEGTSLTNVLKSIRLTAYKFWKYIRGNDQLAEAWAVATIAHVHSLADQCIDIADCGLKPTDRDPDPIRAKNRIAIRQWHASRKAPYIFGDKVQVETTHEIKLLDQAQVLARIIEIRGKLGPLGMLTTSPGQAFSLGPSIDVTPGTLEADDASSISK